LDSRLGLPPNTVLDGSYRISRVVGVGGFGITYEAEDINLSTRVAIKEYYPFDFGDRDNTMRVKPKSDRHKKTFEWGRSNFLQEARTLARFEHPSIVRVVRVFEANSTAYMVMRYESGQSFEGWLVKLNRLPTQEELDAIVAPVLDALEMLHAADFLHRDIAPDNIIVRADGSPVLLDFGAARRAVAEMSRSLTGIVKAGYSPHEQYSSNNRLQGPWSDLYALGGTLYRAVTGRPPEEATLRVSDDRMPGAAEAVRKGRYRPGFLLAIDACLKVRHAERPRSVAQLRAQMFGATGNSGFERFADAFKPSKPSRPSKPSKPSSQPPVSARPTRLTGPRDDSAGRRMWPVAALAVLLLAGGGGAYVYWPWPDAETLSEQEKKADQKRLADNAKREQELAQRLAEAKRAEETRLAEAKKIEDTRRAEDLRVAEARRVEDAKRAEEVRRAEAKRAEDAKRAEEARLAEAKRAEDARKAEEARLAEAKRAEDSRKAEEARLAEAKRAEDARKAEEARLAEVRKADEARRAEQARQAEARKAEEARIAAAKQKADADARAKGQDEADAAGVDEPVTALATDGQWFATGTAKGTVQVWQLSEGAPRRMGSGALGVGRIMAIAFEHDDAGNGKVSASDKDGAIVFWDIQSKRVQQVQAKAGQAKPLKRVFALRYNAAEKQFMAISVEQQAKGGYQTALERWRTDGKAVGSPKAIKAGTRLLQAAAFAPNDDLFAIVASGELMLFNSGRETPVHSEAFGDTVRALAFSPDGRRIAVAGEFEQIKIWEIEDGKQLVRPLALDLRVLQAGKGADIAEVTALTFSPGRYIAAANADNKIAVWDIFAPGKPVATYTGGRLNPGEPIKWISLLQTADKTVLMMPDDNGKMKQVSIGAGG
jgi:serine/threonine protein kinase